MLLSILSTFYELILILVLVYPLRHFRLIRSFLPFCYSLPTFSFNKTFIKSSLSQRTCRFTFLPISSILLTETKCCGGVTEFAHRSVSAFEEACDSSEEFWERTGTYTLHIPTAPYPLPLSSTFHPLPLTPILHPLP